MGHIRDNSGADHGGPGPARYSDLPFPPYRYVPGTDTPHPTRDPGGHSYGRHPEPLEGFDAADWRRCATYLYGIDLFNHGYWWEAHEALEAVWVAAGRNSPAGQFVQGLILLSVAHLKRHQGFLEVARRMAGDGVGRMSQVGEEFMGVDVEALGRAALESFASDGHDPVRVRLADR